MISVVSSQIQMSGKKLHERIDCVSNVYLEAIIFEIAETRGIVFTAKHPTITLRFATSIQNGKIGGQC